MRKTGTASEGRIAVPGSRLMFAAVIGFGLTSALTPGLATAQTGAASGPASAPVSGPATASASTSANGVGSAFELAFWQSLTGNDDSAAYEAYLAKYPDGTFSGLARAKIAAMQRALTVQPAAQQAVAPLAPSTPVAAPIPAPIPAVVTAATPSVAPGQTNGTAPQVAEMMAANASVAVADQSSSQGSPQGSPPSSPLTRLLAQLRGSQDAAAATAAPMVTAAPPVQPVSGGATAPAAQAPVYAAVPAPAPVLVPVQAPAPSPAAASYASARPIMLPVPDVTMPAYFCSNDARNAFHNGSYRPAVEVATRNNEAAVAYLRQLQATYDRGQLGRDTAVLNAIAAEARAYQGEAARAYSAQAALVRQFDVLMTVPLRTCMASAQ